MKEINVDIIIPAKNAQTTIESCIKSARELNLINSAFKINPSLIVIDNNSDDNTEQILQSLNVSYLKCTKVGRSVARNYGLQSTHSPFVVFLDADVILPANWLVEMLGFLDQHPEFSAGESQVNLVEAVESIYCKMQVGKKNDEALLPRCGGVLGVALNSCACIYRREALLKLNGFDEELNSFEDLDLANRLFLNGDFLFSLKNISVQKLVTTENAFEYMTRNFQKGLNSYKLYKKREYTDIFKKWLISTKAFIRSAELIESIWGRLYILCLFFLSYNLGFVLSFICHSRNAIKEYWIFNHTINFNNQPYGILYFNNSFWCYDPINNIKFSISDDLYKFLFNKRLTL